MTGAADRVLRTRDLSRFAYLAIAAAIATITLKFVAWRITGSVGLLSDAAESVVNLVAAVAVLIALKVAAMPADKNHHYGHSKAEYFSAAVEGQMIFIAALAIMWAAVDRFLHPQPIENVGIGLAVSIVASDRQRRRRRRAAPRRAPAPLPDAHGRRQAPDDRRLHLGRASSSGSLLVALTGIQRLDPVIAFLVGLNIVFTGYTLLKESVEGLMDISMTKQENRSIADTLARFVTPDVHFHALRTRVSGHHRFAEVHVLVPGAWSVQQGHDLMEDVEAAVHETFSDVALTCHLEPSEDPRAYGDFSAEFPVPTHDEILASHESTHRADPPAGS